MKFLKTLVVPLAISAGVVTVSVAIKPPIHKPNNPCYRRGFGIGKLEPCSQLGQFPFFFQCAEDSC